VAPIAHLGVVYKAKKQAIRLAPDKSRPRLARAWAYEELGRHDAARADFKAALLLDATLPQAHAGLGYVEAGAGNAVEALGEASSAVLHGGTDYLVLHNVACVYAALAASDPARRRLHKDSTIDALASAIRESRNVLAEPNELQLIEQEQVLKQASLRARPEFRALLAGEAGITDR
jgi:Flp pilus assembly protein TadD